MDKVVDNMIPFGAFAMISWIVYVTVEGVRRWHQQRILGQARMKLLERIGSVEDLGEFVKSGAADRILGAEVEVAHPPAVRIIRATQSGIVLLMLGAGLYAFPVMRPLDPGATTAIVLIGTIMATLGIGLLLSAAASYRLSRQLGLLNNVPR